VQTFPHDPQLLLLDKMLISQSFVEFKSQFLKIDAHCKHDPDWHVDNEVNVFWQTLPHDPQFSTVFILVHTPLQFVVPNGHVQKPAWQLLPPVQTFPHDPQLLLLDKMLISQPFVEFKSQFLKIDAHCKHDPDWQVDKEVTVFWQTLLHDPQLIGSNVRSAMQS